MTALDDVGAQLADLLMRQRQQQQQAGDALVRLVRKGRYEKRQVGTEFEVEARRKAGERKVAEETARAAVPATEKYQHMAWEPEPSTLEDMRRGFVQAMGNLPIIGWGQWAGEAAMMTPPPRRFAGKATEFVVEMLPWIVGPAAAGTAAAKIGVAGGRAAHAVFGPLIAEVAGQAAGEEMQAQERLGVQDPEVAIGVGVLHGLANLGLLKIAAPVGRMVGGRIGRAIMRRDPAETMKAISATGALGVGGASYQAVIGVVEEMIRTAGSYQDFGQAVDRIKERMPADFAGGALTALIMAGPSAVHRAFQTGRILRIIDNELDTLYEQARKIDKFGPQGPIRDYAKALLDLREQVGVAKGIPPAMMQTVQEARRRLASFSRSDLEFEARKRGINPEGMGDLDLRAAIAENMAAREITARARDKALPGRTEEENLAVRVLQSRYTPEERAAAEDEALQRMLDREQGRAYGRAIAVGREQAAAELAAEEELRRQRGEAFEARPGEEPLAIEAGRPPIAPREPGAPPTPPEPPRPGETAQAHAQRMKAQAAARYTGPATELLVSPEAGARLQAIAGGVSPPQEPPPEPTGGVTAPLPPPPPTGAPAAPVAPAVPTAPTAPTPPTPPTEAAPVVSVLPAAPPAAAAPAEKDLDTMTLGELQEESRRRNLPVRGSRDALIERLRVAREREAQGPVTRPEGGALLGPEGVVAAAGELAGEIAGAPLAGRMLELGPSAELLKPEQRRVAQGQLALSTELRDRLKAGGKIDNETLFQAADRHFKGTRAQGIYESQDAYEALEIAVNRLIMESDMSPAVGDVAAKANLRRLEALNAQLPPRPVRSQQQQQLQQFSTPPAYAYLAVWAAKLKPGDIVLEPSAGVGALAAWARKAGATVITNELDPKRSALLEALQLGRNYRENADRIDLVLGPQLQRAPSVVIMNPPFSAKATMGGKRVHGVDAGHVEAAIRLVQPNGRVVAIVGQGLAPDAPKAAEFWNRMRSRSHPRAAIGIPGAVYERYGTSFGTRLLVFDKGGDPSNLRSESVPDLASAVDLLYAPRAVAVQPRPAGTAGPGAASTGGQGPGGRGASVQPPVGPVVGPIGAGGPGTPQRPGGLGGGASGVGSGQGAGVPVQPQGQPSVRPPVRPPEPEAGGEAPVGEPGTPAEGEGPGVRLETNIEAEGAETKAIATESVHQVYQPRLIAKGSKPHPNPLSETASMASVDPPNVKYRPHLPIEVVAEGKLSSAQLESVMLIGEAHQRILPSGERQGFLNGDGTGVGKGRQITAVIWDNWRQGRTKAVWVSKTKNLIRSAARDVEDTGWDPKVLFAPPGSPKDKIKQTEGVLFTTYSTLGTNRGAKEKEGEEQKVGPRFRQLVEWLGKDFDGVIAFDEAHIMSNVLAGERDPDARGEAVVSKSATMARALAKALPKARVVYFSATPVTQVRHLAYADRLGLWGDPAGPFPDVKRFISQIESKGLAGMELVSRDLKARGLFIARDLAMRDPENRPNMSVEYEPLVHELTAPQRQMYDTLAEAWQIVLDNMGTAASLTGAPPNQAGSVFWSRALLFFQSVINGMKIPGVIPQIEKDLAEGRSVVIQLVNTGEASQEAALSKASEDTPLDEIDMSPREQLMTYVEDSFPVHEWETYTDDEGVERIRVMLDSNGQPVINPEAVKLRDDLLRQLGSITAPNSAVDQLIEHFGPDAIAEITGRKQRRISGKWTAFGQAEMQKRNDAILRKEQKDYEDRKRRIAILSMKGLTGESWHADKGIINQDRRAHYLFQVSWQAQQNVQGLGRSHRSNQTSAPLVRLVTTDIKPELRFTSTTAGRLEQLGALARAERRATGATMFSSEQNLESRQAKAALTDLYYAIYNGQATISLEDFERMTHLRLTDSKGGMRRNLPPMSRFLNRLMMLKLGQGNELFEAFNDFLQARIAAAKASGTLDMPMEQIRGKNVRELATQQVGTDPVTGAPLKIATISAMVKAVRVPFSDTTDKGFYRNVKSGRIYNLLASWSDTDPKTGAVKRTGVLTGPKGPHGRYNMSELEDTARWELVDRAEARRDWEAEYAKLPAEEERRHDLLTGPVLGIWDRLPPLVDVKRAVTDAGKTFLGLSLSESEKSSFLSKMGVAAEVPEWAKSAPDIVTQVLAGKIVYMGPWRIEARMVSGEKQIELFGPGFEHQKYLNDIGIKSSVINYVTRHFIPQSRIGEAAIATLIARRPVTGIGSKTGGRPDDRRAFFYSGPIEDAIRYAIKAGKWTAQHVAKGATWIMRTLGPYARPLQALKSFTVAFGRGAAKFFKAAWRIYKDWQGLQPPLPLALRSSGRPVDPMTVSKLATALDSAKPPRVAYEQFKSEELSRRSARLKKTMERIGGRRGAKMGRRHLAGEMRKPDFEPIGDQFTEAEKDALADHVIFHDTLKAKPLTAQDLVNDVLVPMMDDGYLPTIIEIRQLEKLFGPDVAAALIRRRKRISKIIAIGEQIYQTPLTLLAAPDLSLTLRQAGAATVRHPLVAFVTMPSERIVPGAGKAPAFWRQVRAWASESYARAWDDALRTRPMANLAEKSGVRPRSLEPTIVPDAIDERFRATWLEKIPVIGGLVRASNRAAATYTNTMQAWVFDSNARLGLAKGMPPSWFKNVADIANNSVGRSRFSMGDFGPFLRAALFSPQYQIARFEMPVSLARSANKEGLRKYAASMLAAQALVTLTTAWLVKEAAQAFGMDIDVELDPRSTNFLRFTVKGPRGSMLTIDFPGGYGNPIRLVAQLLMGQRKDVRTGLVQKAERGITFGYWIGGKLHPVPRLMVDLWTGKAFGGEKPTLAGEAESTLVPITAQNILEATEEFGAAGAWSGIPDALGLGANVIPANQAPGAREPRPPRPSQPGRPARPPRPAREPSVP